MELGNLFTEEEVGMIYTPEAFCDVTTGEDCYLLTGGAVLSGTWFQPAPADVYNMNFRMTNEMTATSTCLYQD